MPRLPSASMLSDITNVLTGVKPRQLCQEVLKEVCKTPVGSPQAAESADFTIIGKLLPPCGGDASSPVAKPHTKPASCGGITMAPPAPAGEAAAADGAEAAPPAPTVIPLAAAARDAAILEAALRAVRKALDSKGAMDSEWTSSLALELEAAGVSSCSILECVLREHGWSGGQFAGPPDRGLLLADLRRAAAAVAGGRKRSRRGGA